MKGFWGKEAPVGNGAGWRDGEGNGRGGEEKLRAWERNTEALSCPEPFAQGPPASVLVAQPLALQLKLKAKECFQQNKTVGGAHTETCVGRWASPRPWGPCGVAAVQAGLSLHEGLASRDVGQVLVLRHGAKEPLLSRALTITGGFPQPMEEG